MKTIAKPVKKGQNGLKESRGYSISGGPFKTNSYEKKVDTIGAGSTRSVRSIDGKGNVLRQERLGTQAAKKIASDFKREKANTNLRRQENKDFLTSREAIGKAASKKPVNKAVASLKNGGAVKKAKCGTMMKKR